MCETGAGGGGLIEGPDRLPEDRYLVTDLLGEGGMARVWRAWHRARGTWCAVKILRPRFAREASARRRFMDEAKTMVRLVHRNVIQAWEIGDADPPYLVLEVADAGSLKDWGTRNGAMPARMAVGVAIQVCKGIGEAHRSGVIHRDVNPRNVLVNRKGVCKVSDFGIARIRRDDGSDDVPDATTVHSGDAMGTLGYMAPEQRSDPRRADVRTDVYGIGATLYDLLTGQAVTNLFMAEREPDMLTGIPDVLRPILLRAVAYHPEERYPEVAELAKALYYSRAELPEDPPGTRQLAEGLPPEPAPPQGLTVPLVPGIQPMDDLEVPTTFIRKPVASRNTPDSARRTAPSASRVAPSTPDPHRRSSDGGRIVKPEEPKAPAWEGGSVSPNTHGKSRETDRSGAPSWETKGSRSRRSDGSRNSRRVVQAEPSWVSGIDHELPPKRRIWRLLAAATVVLPLSMLGLDTAWVQRAENNALYQRTRFVKSVKDEAPVLDELHSLRLDLPRGTVIVGADADTLNRMFHLATQQAERPVHLERAHAYVDALTEAASPFAVAEGRTSQEVRSRIQSMNTELAEWEVAVEVWNGRAGGLCGRIPTLLGLVNDPETE